MNRVREPTGALDGLAAQLPLQHRRPAPAVPFKAEKPTGTATTAPTGRPARSGIPCATKTVQGRVFTDLVIDETNSARVALVAGATRGAGRAIAVELAQAGFFAYVTGRSTCDASRSW